MENITKSIINKSLLLLIALSFSACTFQQPNNLVSEAKIKSEPDSVEEKLNKLIEVGTLNKNDSVSVINVGENGPSFLTKVSFENKNFSLKDNISGSLEKLPSDIAKVDVYLIELSSPPVPGSDPMATGNVIGSTLGLAKTGNNFNVLFQKIPANTSGKKYYVGVIAKDSSNNVINKDPSVAWTGNTLISSPALAITDTGVGVNTALEVDTTVGLSLSIALLDATGAKVNTAVTPADGTIVGNVISNLIYNCQLLITAGNSSGVSPTTNNQIATSVKLNNPYGIGSDVSGNIYVADTTNGYIEKIDTNGNLKIIAGNPSGVSPSTNNQVATNVKLLSPYAVTTDLSGNIYFTDSGNHYIEKIDTNGDLKIIAGKTGGSAPSTNNQIATDIVLGSPRGITSDSSGNIYITDSNNNFIEKIDTNGNLKIIAGKNSGLQPSVSNQVATAVQLSLPYGIAVDSSGNIYFADSNNHFIEKIDTNGNLKIIAGKTGGTSPSVLEQVATNVVLGNPRGLSIDSLGNVYFADSNSHYIEKIDTNGNLKIIAGKSSGSAPSTTLQFATNVQLDQPYGVTIDSSGNMYISDQTSNYIEKITGL